MFSPYIHSAAQIPHGARGREECMEQRVRAGEKKGERREERAREGRKG